MKANVSKKTAEIKPAVLRAVVDDGTREIPLVNKFDKLICNIYIRPADFSIIDRYNDLKDRIESIVAPLKELSLNNDGTATFEKDWEVLKKVEEDVKREFDALFDMEEADEIFAKRNPFSSVHGQFFALRVFEALGGILEQAIAEEAALSQKRVAKYLTQSESTEGVKDAGDAAEDA